MKRPNSLFSVWAQALVVLGAVFCILGFASFVRPIPMRSGEAWMFLFAGLPLLLCGGVCALLAQRKRSVNARLRAEGVPVSGRVRSVKHHRFAAVKTIDFRSRRGRTSHWSVLCEYTWEGRTYTVRSGLLWSKPGDGEQHPVIYLDPQHPKNAFVAPDSIRPDPFQCDILM